MFNSLIIWYVLAVATLIEAVILYVKAPKQSRFVIGSITVLLLGATHTALLSLTPLVFAVPFYIVGLFRMLNMMRFGYGRMHESYLYRVTRQTTWCLWATQLAIAALTVGIRQLHLHTSFTAILVGLIQLAVITVGLWSIIKNLAASRASQVMPLTDKQLPSLTVAIPARNETQDLADCLSSFVASDYQKLEILVLDDCSQDKTSDVIKGFAHDGVRFVRGDEPGDTWLAKNAAYEKLAHEASSQLILFCGVDVRVKPDTLRNLVSYMNQTNSSMLSLLPLRQNGSKSTATVQQVRYLWELALPRFMTQRPPVLSTLWLIDRGALKKLGGLGAVRRAIVPEGFFARELGKQNKYHFVRANSQLAVFSTKQAKEQRRSALRVRYPQLHRRPEVAMAVIAAELLGIVGVLPLLFIAVHWHYSAVVAVTAISLVLQVVCLLVLAQAYSSNLVISVAQGILAVPFDIVLIIKSMYCYEFNEVYWKQRNVCLPVMHVEPALPHIQ
jgi:hypothetical protein